MLGMQLSAQNVDLAYDLADMGSEPIGVYKTITLSDGGDFTATALATGLLVSRNDANGNILWSELLSSSAPLFSGWSLALRELADGGLAILQGVNDGIAPSTALLRLTATGDLLWSKRLALSGFFAAEYDQSSDVQEKPNGHLVLNLSDISRFVVAELEADGDLLWCKSYKAIDDPDYPKDPAFGLKITDNGEILVCGKDRDWPFIVRVNANGDVIWGRSYLTVGLYSHWRHVRQLPNGDLLVAGMTDNTALFARLAPSGAVLWVKALPNLTYVSDMIDLGNEEYLLSSTYEYDIYHVNANGDLLGSWARPLLTSGYWMYPQLAGAFDGSVDISGVIYLYDDLGLSSTSPFVERVPLGSAVTCDGASTAISLTGVPSMVGLMPVENCIQANEVLNVDDAGFSATPIIISATSVCAMITGVAENATPVLSAYPTPVAQGGIFHIDMAGVLLHPEIVLTNALGQELLRTRPAVAATIDLPTNGLAPGSYHLRISDGPALVAVQRVVIQ